MRRPRQRLASYAYSSSSSSSRGGSADWHCVSIERRWTAAHCFSRSLARRAELLQPGAPRNYILLLARGRVTEKLRGGARSDDGTGHGVD